MRKPTAIAAFWVVGLGPVGGPALAAPLPATLTKALEGAELDTADAWAYRKTTQVDTMDEPAVKSVVLWDPSKPEGERCTVVSLEVTPKAHHKDRRDASDDDPCAALGILAPVAVVIGALQAQLALRLLETATAVAGLLYVYEMRGRRWRTLRFERGSQCSTCSAVAQHAA